MAVDLNFATELYGKIKPYINDKGILEVVVRDKNKKFAQIPKILINELKDSDKKDVVDKAVKALNNNAALSEALKMSANVASKIGVANLILNSLNLCATCAGFAIMYAKLDKMSSVINQKLNAIKVGQEQQTTYEFDKVISHHMDMLDSRRRKQDYPEKEMRELVDEEYNILKRMIAELGNNPVGDIDSLIFSIYSMASMLAVSIKYFDEIYYFNNAETITDGNPWHTSHDKWVSILEQLLTSEFLEVIQDHAYFDLNLSTTEADAYYISLSEQVTELKRSIKDTQYILKRIDNKEMYEAFLAYTRQDAREQFEKKLTDAGLDVGDEKIADSLEDAYRQVALA